MRNLALLAPLLAACGADTHYVGAIDDHDARIGAVVGSSAITVYMCGGDDSFDSHTRWFSGTHTDGVATLEDPDGWMVEWDNGVGEVTAPVVWSGTFSAVDVSDSDIAGVYDARESGCRDGALVWENGGQPELQGVHCIDDQTFFQVTPVGTLALQDLGIEVTAPSADGEPSFFVTRVATD